MIHVVDGDLLESDCSIIGHQVNCRGVMGAGLARQIKERYPNVFIAYRNVCSEAYQQDLLGHCQLVRAREGLIVANLFAQLDYGRNGRYTDYDALQKSMITLCNWYNVALDMLDDREPKIGLPYGIGSGLAGGKWSTVYDIIDVVFQGKNIYLYRKG